MTIDRKLSHNSMGDDFDGEDKRVEQVTDREIAERVLARIAQLQAKKHVISTYEAKVLSTLFRSAMRRDESLDSPENRRLLGLIDGQSGGALIDPSASPPHEVVNAEFERERRLRSLNHFFDDLVLLAGDGTVSKDEKGFVYSRLQEALNYYETAVKPQDDA